LLKFNTYTGRAAGVLLNIQLFDKALKHKRKDWLFANTSRGSTHQK